MTDLPEKVDRPPPAPAPTRISSRDFELVIRRAAELQARESENVGDGSQSGMDVSEVVRIGQEIGLSQQHLQRALVEVTGGGEPESGILATFFGPTRVRASRVLVGPATQVAVTLERYLLDREYLAVQRRLPGGRLTLVRASGVAAAVGRGWSYAVNRSPLLAVSNLEVVVAPIDETSSYVTVSTDLRSARTGTALASFLGGGWAAGAAGAALGIAVATPLAVVAIPVLAGSVYGGRLYFQGAVERMQVQLESLLDRLEHGELTIPSRSRVLPRR